MTATMAADVECLVDPLDEDPVNAGGSSFAFEMTDYVGAVDPNASSNWFSEWLLMDVEGDNCPLVSNPTKRIMILMAVVMPVIRTTTTTGRRYLRRVPV